MEDLFLRAAKHPGYKLTVDLDALLTDEFGLSLPFEVEAFRRHCLLNGLDDIGLSSNMSIKSRPSRRSTEWPRFSCVARRARAKAVMSHEFYENPLIRRYASPEMSRLWGDDKKFRTWRQLWVWLAEAEAELGLPIAPAQIAELRSKTDAPSTLGGPRTLERRLRHDVMAHIHAYGGLAPRRRTSFTSGPPVAMSPTTPICS